MSTLPNIALYVILALAILNTVCTILLWWFLSLHIAKHINFVTLDWEWRTQLGKTMTATARARRDNHLEIMKVLKGESYAGKMGEFDIHTDPNIPPGGEGISMPK